MDRTLAGTFAALTAAGIVAVLHRLSNGALLANRGGTLIVFVAALVALVALCRGRRLPRLPRSSNRELAERGWWLLAGPAVLLVLATWWGDPGGLPGDYTQHRMYTYQLLNGFASPHVPYAGVPGHYTPLQSVVVAIWMHATGLSFHFAALSVAAAVSALVARFAYHVARGAGLEPRAALFFGGLLVGYGGFWWVGQDDYFLYLPAVQLSMPFLARNLALLLVLLALRWAQRLAARDVSEVAAAVGLGILAGLLGLTRPWEFAAALLALMAWAVRSRSRSALGALALSIGISLCYFGPLVAAWLELGIQATREVERPVFLPTSPFLYAPLVGFLALAVLKWEAAPAAIRGCGLALAALAVAAVLGAAATALGLPRALGLDAGLLKLDRTGQLIALPLFAVSAYGAGCWRARAAPWLLVAFLVVGWVSAVRVTSTWLDGSPALWSLRWQQPPSWVFGMEGSRLHLRNHLDDPRAVVMTPVAIGDLIARSNGVDVVYSRTAVPIWRERPSGDFSAEQRRDLAERFYAALQSGRIDGGILRAVGARWFVAPIPVGTDRVEEVATLGHFGGVLLRLYRVREAADD